MQKTPRGMRTHITFLGRRNAGKSSLVNAILARQASIVSAVAGTTTDPVSRAMELEPLGPVLLVDTAGIDDDSTLGERRIAKTEQMLERTDLGVVVCAVAAWGEVEESLLAELASRGTPALVVLHKTDLVAPPPALTAELRQRGLPCVCTAVDDAASIEALRLALAAAAPPPGLAETTIVADLVPPGELAVLVMPIDTAAPKGRLILPQVQTIRDLLDGNAMSLVVQETELTRALSALRHPPALVVTDSQAFQRVVADVPPSVPLTSFSILFARLKGDLSAFVEGARAVGKLRPGDRVLMLEACAHRPVSEDIGRVKIPAWLRAQVGELHFEHMQGHDFPADLEAFSLVVHCGACVQNRKQVLSRIARCRQAGVPITNYGLCIASALGVLERALSPFPALQATQGDAGSLPPGWG